MYDYPRIFSLKCSILQVQALAGRLGEQCKGYAKLSGGIRGP